MAEQLVIYGFKIAPIIQRIDIDKATCRDHPVGELVVTDEQMLNWRTAEWPLMWESVRAQFAETQRLQATIPESEPPNRTGTRAVTRKGGKHNGKTPATVRKAPTKPVAPNP